MKNYTICLLLALFGTVSCSDWLDVSPKSESREDEFLSTEAGFKSALIGAYIRTASTTLYGRNLTMLIPESFTQHWAIPAASGFQNREYTQLCRHSALFEMDVQIMESTFTSIWNTYYNAILHINNVLDKLAVTDVAFQFNNEHIIRAEALGLRAFLHFEIMRFYGPAPNRVEGSAATIPYVEVATNDPNQLLSEDYATVMGKILRDLNEAEELLAVYDPIHNYTIDELNLELYNYERPEDEWHYYRQQRFNYYAVLGAKARYYLWTGDNVKAAEYAKKVIEGENPDGTAKFNLADEVYLAARERNIIIECEHLFSTQNDKHYSLVYPLIEDSGYQILNMPASDVNAAYESGAHPNDIRNRANRFWMLDTGDIGVVNKFVKYGHKDYTSTSGLVPLMRLAEMYLIAVECLPVEEAKVYLETYRISRDLSSNLTASFDETTKRSILEKEYRKEFYGEGQMFHYYKRNDVTSYEWPAARNTTVELDKYVFPKPDGQIIFE